MKKKQYVIHNRGLSQILFSSPWSLRSIFKHFVVASYIALITLIVFKFDVFKNVITNAMNGSGEGSITDVAKLYAPKIAWDILLIFLELKLLKRTLKMLQMSNRNIWVFMPFALIALGFGIYSAVFLPDWMSHKISAESNFVDGFKHLSVFIYFYLGLCGITIVWSLFNAFNERNISPFVAKANIFTAINMSIYVLFLLTIWWLAKILFLNVNPVSFNYKDNLQMFLMISSALLLILLFAVKFWTLKHMRNKNNDKFFSKNVRQGIEVSMIVPLAIWLGFSFLHIKGNWMEWFFVGIVSFCVLFSVIYLFSRKTESGSPRVFMVIISFLLAIIWMSKYFFEYFWNYNVSAQLTLPVAVIGTAIIMVVLYLKSPMVSNIISFLFSEFIKSLWIAVVATWGVSLLPIISELIPEVPESLNLMLVVLPISILVITLLYWYITQWKIKAHVVIEKKQKNIKQKSIKKKNMEQKNIKKKDLRKEATNA